MSRNKHFTEQEVKEAARLYEDELFSIQATARVFHSSAGVLEKYFKKYNIHIRTKEENTIIRMQKSKITNLKIFGVDNCSKNAEIKKKKQETVLKHYGVDSPLKSEVIKSKIRKTNLQKYGHVNTFQNYKGPNPFSISEVQEKSRATLLDKYGVDNPQKSEAIREKTRATCVKKYGVENYAQSAEYMEKARKTDLEKYGVENHITKMRKHVQYLYDEIFFDSKWELCFYIYHVEHGNMIIREPCKFEYSFNGIKHYFHPDFLVNGKLIEIKSDYLFKQMLVPNTKENVKYQICLDKGIEILLGQNCERFIKYCEDKNGKNFEKQYKYYKNRYDTKGGGAHV
ncbi:MAG: hypothetical protein MJ237_09195 [bacterium]|nr:hypothetical protein [bacterium]